MSVNMTETEPRKFYLFLHGPHVYMASDSISEKYYPLFSSPNSHNSNLRIHQMQYTIHIIHDQTDWHPELILNVITIALICPLNHSWYWELQVFSGCSQHMSDIDSSTSNWRKEFSFEPRLLFDWTEKPFVVKYHSIFGFKNNFTGTIEIHSSYNVTWIICIIILRAAPFFEHH